MRALRDYNVPKIVTDDVPVFMGLIGDLFPALDVPRKKDLDFEKAVKEAAVDLKLQPEDSFILKVRGFMAVRPASPLKTLGQHKLFCGLPLGRISCIYPT